MPGPTADDLILSTRTLRHAGFTERVEAAAAAGWRYIGIDDEDHERARCEGLDDAAMARLLDTHGVGVAEIEMLGDWAHGGEREVRSRESEERLLHLAATFGARHLNVGRNVEGDPDHVAARFAGICRRAAERGVVVALEFMPFTNIPDLDAAWQIVRRAGEDNGGVLLDTWHLRRSGGTDAQLAEVPADRIVSIQLADVGPHPGADLREEALHDRRLPGEGVGDLAGLLRTLDRLGVRAPVSLEVMSDATDALPPRRAAERALTTTRALLSAARPCAVPSRCRR